RRSSTEPCSPSTAASSRRGESVTRANPTPTEIGIPLPGGEGGGGGGARQSRASTLAPYTPTLPSPSRGRRNYRHLDLRTNRRCLCRICSANVPPVSRP